MKQTLVLGIAFAAAMSLPALAQSESEWVPHRYHVHRHVHHDYVQRNAPEAVVVAPAAVPGLSLGFPHIAPYSDGDGDTGGLSEDVNDCNKGCVENPY